MLRITQYVPRRISRGLDSLGQRASRCSSRAAGPKLNFWVPSNDMTTATRCIGLAADDTDRVYPRPQGWRCERTWTSGRAFAPLLHGEIRQSEHELLRQRVIRPGYLEASMTVQEHRETPCPELASSVHAGSLLSTMPNDRPVFSSAPPRPRVAAARPSYGSTPVRAGDRLGEER